jgi:dihydroorotate dehydrogenase
MLIRGVRFNYCFDQSGVRNFYGEGYPYHKLFRVLPGFRFDGSTFVAKTTTLVPRRGIAYREGGNMPLRPDGVTPSEFKPRCIFVSPRSWVSGAALNAVGLAGPGVQALLTSNKWHEYPMPFMISVMTVSNNPKAELEQLVDCIKLYLPFMAKFGVQLNMSCPNVEHAQEVATVVQQTAGNLAILRELGPRVPLVVKLNALFPIQAAKDMADDPNCDGFCNSNTIPWNDIPERIRLELFGMTVSPLQEFGGGGLSGAWYLLRLVEKWVADARAVGITKPIIAGGGIMFARNVDLLAACGASAVAVGSVAILRPWRVKSIITRANELGQRGRFYTPRSSYVEA